MRGWFRNSKAPKPALLVLTLTLLSAFSQQSSAHVPSPGQIVRYQPNMLRSQHPFSIKGAATGPNGRSKMASVLLWFGPAHYQFTMTNVSRSFYTQDFSSTWVLYREGKNCVLKTDTVVVNCPSSNFWANLEFSGEADLTAKSLQRADLLDSADLRYHETDGRQIMASGHGSTEHRVQLAVGANGPRPVAVLEIRGDNYTAEIPGEEHPILQFDQSFLNPLLARWMSDGDLVTIHAEADDKIETHHPRLSHVYASRLEVDLGKVPVAVFSRGEAVPMTSASATALPRAITDLTALKNQLSSEGQNFLRALLVTH